MFQNLDCIALRTIRYSDRKWILNVYTRQLGRLALALPASAGRNAMRLRALTLPMSRFSCEVDIRPNRDIFQFSDLRPTASHPGNNPVKSTLALFVADLLAALLREPQPDAHLFDFLSLSLDFLAEANATQTANFHLVLLLKMQHFLGIEPDWSTYRPGAIFDMADGIFRPASAALSHNSAADATRWGVRFLSPEESRYAFTLRHLTFANSTRFRLSQQVRNRILNHLLDYYHIHFPTLSTLSSLSVLRSLFS